ncbi:uncharacterized protein LOC130116341 [Lampris incognitus]|uniref:uncharacterized protein LOC130116341 n=1 Tax=Lampris incognitus TaxID=2546036 RepID=UPI0024B5779F|nr:uncharacterized protein LOC130116341 [Lampris incognitus]
MEAACRMLINMLDHRSRSFLTRHRCRHPVVFHETGYDCVTSSGKQRLTSTTQDTLHGLAAPTSNATHLKQPLRTSLRSLQAVRDSRGGEDHAQCPAERISCLTCPHTPKTMSGLSPAQTQKSSWSSSFSSTYMGSTGSLVGSQQSLGQSSVQTMSLKGLRRAQSLSPSNSRIPHPAKGFSRGAYLSGQSRIFASPERSTALAWGRNVRSTRR